jgi:hypothetical protein
MHNTNPITKEEIYIFTNIPESDKLRVDRTLFTVFAVKMYLVIYSKPEIIPVGPAREIRIDGIFNFLFSLDIVNSRQMVLIFKLRLVIELTPN